LKSNSGHARAAPTDAWFRFATVIVKRAASSCADTTFISRHRVAGAWASEGAASADFSDKTVVYPLRLGHKITDARQLMLRRRISYDMVCVCSADNFFKA
jgi:hypothetical protein